MQSSFELAVDVHCTTGESPVWVGSRAELIFVDIPGRLLYRYQLPQGGAAAGGNLWTMNIAEDIGCVAAAREGGYVAGLRSGIWLLDESGAPVRRLAENPENPAVSRFNDGRVDPRGRYFSGTLDETRNGRAALYRYDHDGLHKLADGLTTTNGLAFSPDGRTMYFSDTPRFVIYRCDYDPQTGETGNKREFVRIEPTAGDRGRPDGAAVDAEGCYWSSLYEGSRLHRYDPDGKLMSVHPVPARNPTMPAFGGPDLKTLFVTTARDKTTGEGGGVYCKQVEVSGLPNPMFDPRA